MAGTTVSGRPVRVLVVSTHPVQYGSPLLRRFAEDPRLDLTVAYCSLQGAKPGVDPEFGVEVAWDVPLLDGYRWTAPLNRSPRPGLRGFFALLNPGLWRLVRRGSFDVVICFGYQFASFWIAITAARSSRAALVLASDAIRIQPSDGLTWKIPVKRIALPIIFRIATALFVPSTKARAFVQSLGVPRKRVFLVPYVVDTSFFATRSDTLPSSRVRHRLGATSDEFLVLFVGKLVPRKRPGDVIDAVAALRGVTAVLVGEGPLRSNLEARAVALGVADRVRFTGFVNQTGLPELYAAADVLVLPSEHEAFGLVVNEAFACGTPAVVSEACGAVGDLVIDGETGYSFPVGDTRRLAELLRRLKSDRHLLESMGQRARQRLTAWGPDQNVEAFVDACLTLARRRQAVAKSST